MPSHNQGYQVIIEGISSTTIPEFICHGVTRRLLGEQRSTVETVPGRAGGWFYPERPGMRQITIDASVLADTFPGDRRNAVRSVARWVDGLSLLKLQISDDPGVYNLAFLSDPPDVDEWRETGRMELSFLAHPYTFSNDVQTFQHVQAAGNTATFNVTVGGDVETRPVVTIASTGPTTVGIFIANGRTLTHTAAVPTTQLRTINNLARIVEINTNSDPNVLGTFATANLSMAGVAGRFPVLRPGVNSVTITSTGATAFTANFFWRNLFR